MNELSKHYELLLGLEQGWSVSDVKLDIEGQQIELFVQENSELIVRCPECNRACPMADHAPERSWRHLDTMQFSTIIHARIPRSRCFEHGTKNIQTSWASPNSRFTLLFEAFAIEVLQNSSSISQACRLLRIDWKYADRLMKRAVERGLQRREIQEIKYLGIDEKSWCSGHEYTTVLTDLDNKVVIDLAQDRTRLATEKLFKKLPSKHLNSVKAVAMDMHKPHMNAAVNTLPEATVVHDKYHIVQILNKCISQVRRSEHRRLTKYGSRILSGTINKLLCRSSLRTINLDFDKVKSLAKSTARVWVLKEVFCKAWSLKSYDQAKQFIHRWIRSAKAHKHFLIQRLGNTIEAHLEGILSYFKHPITNAFAEGTNSQIQQIISNARGFHSFENMRTRVLFYLGKLDIKP